MEKIKGYKIYAFDDTIFCYEDCTNLDNNQCRVTGEFLKKAKSEEYDLYYRNTHCKLFQGGMRLADNRESSVIDEDGRIFLNKIESILI